MKANIIQIGNSRGLRIPKPVLQQCNLEGEVELEVRDGCLVVSAASRPRTEWDSMFETMAKHGDDQLPDHEQTGTSWDDEEWEW